MYEGLSLQLIMRRDAVKNFAVWEDPDVDIGYDDVVKVTLSLVGEKEIRHPHFFRIRQS